MKVRQVENFKIPNAELRETTQEELQREFDYYRAQQVLETMFMFGMINDSNLLFTKASIKLLIWFSLFMIFLAKVKDENEKISRLRIKAICYAIYLLGIYYIVMLVRGVYNGNLEEADNSIAIVYMVFNVICLEFGVQKSRVDRLFKK